MKSIENTNREPLIVLSVIKKVKKYILIPRF